MNGSLNSQQHGVFLEQTRLRECYQSFDRSVAVRSQDSLQRTEASKGDVIHITPLMVIVHTSISYVYVNMIRVRIGTTLPFQPVCTVVHNRLPFTSVYISFIFTRTGTIAWYEWHLFYVRNKQKYIYKRLYLFSP